MECSKIRGTIGTDKKELYTVGDERFFLTTVTLQGSDIPIVASEYIIKDITGKCDIECYVLTRDKDDSKKLFTYIYARKITVCADQTLEDINEFSLGGRVTKVEPPKIVGSQGTDILNFTISYRSGTSKFNIVHCLVSDKIARQLSTLEKGQVVSGKGYIQLNRKALEFVLHECASRKARPIKNKKGVKKC